MSENLIDQGSGLGKLCSTCRNMFNDWDSIIYRLEMERPNEIPYYDHARIWIASADDGCVFCLRMLDNLDGADVLRKTLAFGTELRMRTLIDSSFRRFSIYSEFFEAGQYRSSDKIGAAITYLDPEIPVFQPKLERSTGSFTSLAFAKNWLKICTDSHQQCSREQPARLPTRLLRLCREGVRLFTPEKMDVACHYSTLSHCWGKINMFKLTKKNIDALHQRVPIDVLCKTFQDAIIVTKALGLEYLWIDSLCIIQDDEHDWDQESATMADIYGNAVVNIAATNAIDGSAGLFVERSTVRASRQMVRTDTNISYTIIDSLLERRCLDRTPLSRRAWVFQERYLAKRTIHFTAEQIFCECRYHTVCESFPTGLEDKSYKTTFPTRVTRDSPNEWRKIVEFYSRALLTVPKDKLVALSGVAHQFQAKNRDQYCAGLWRKTLELDLCWRIDGTYPDQPPIQNSALQYRAPT